ncbi:MAG TPA: oligogalacturonate lyase family protein [Opitutus sp.]|nr:oligogalacturonate lyase family protein [Opitutus sp.]
MNSPKGVLSRHVLLTAAALAFAAADAVAAEEPPTSWIDPDTGHRVIRLTNEPGSDSFYFNVNAYTPDGKRMVYTTPEGISILDLATHAAHLVVRGPAKAVVVATRTPTLYYTKPADAEVSSLWSVNLDNGTPRHIADLPRRASVVTINADETLGAGTFIEGDAHAGGAYDGTRRQAPSRMSVTNLGEPVNKGEMMTRRLAAKLPMTMFTIELATGKMRPLLEHDTNWLNHLQFSPTDPTLLMYCHEGHWWLVDRIWTIRTDGTHNQLMHRRQMKMEIAGHEWWGADGQTIYYQLHFPYHARVSFIASVNVATGEREWLSYAPDETSIHDNSSPDGKLFCGDGDKHSPWIFLFRPHVVRDDGTIGEHLIAGGYLEAEKLVNMAKHNYRLEPNPSFTPDMKYVVFRSNMFGPDYAFAVELAKAR